MKPLSAPARPLVERPEAPRLRRVPRPTPSDLRRERDRLFQSGRFERARRVAEQLARLEPSREAFLRLANILRDAGEIRRSLKAYRDALRFKDGAAYLIPEIHFNLAHAWYKLNEYKRMGESLRRAYDSRPKARLEASLHLSFGNYHLSYRRYREALEEFVRAEAAATNRVMRGRAQSSQAIALFYQRRLSEAFDRIDSALRTFEKAGLPEEIARTRYVKGCFHFDEGQYQRTFSMTLRAAREFERIGDRTQMAEALFVAGYAASEVGRWAESRELLDECAALSDRSARRHLRIVSLAARARCHASLDDFDQASHDLSEAQRLLKGFRDWIGTMHVYRTRAHLAGIFENWSEMRRWSRRAERLAVRKDDPVRVAEFRARRARAEEMLGRRRAAIHARKGASALESLLGAGSRIATGAGSLASRLAGSDLPVLILGESGVGKTELARRLHREGPRARNPLVVVPCEQLSFVGSDVAGHEAGAWSGAGEKSLGYARRAAEGTLVLDRVDELPAVGQRFLVPIVEGRVRPIGSASEARVEARVIAVARKAERLIPELRARLEGAVVHLAPLRERRLEIPWLVRDFLRGRRLITADALALLAAQPWKGNLPELEARLEQILALGSGPIGVKTVRRFLKTPDRARVAARKETLRRMAEALK